jgi:hypothetical protein
MMDGGDWISCRFEVPKLAFTSNFSHGIPLFLQRRVLTWRQRLWRLRPKFLKDRNPTWLQGQGVLWGKGSDPSENENSKTWGLGGGFLDPLMSISRRGKTIFSPNTKFGNSNFNTSRKAAIFKFEETLILS